jgi:hypothetical protein
MTKYTPGSKPCQLIFIPTYEVFYKKPFLDYNPIMNDIPQVFNALVETVSSILHEYYSPDCCIAATKCGIEVCKYFGIVAWPIAARLKIFNPTFCRLVGELDCVPQSDQESAEWAAKGAWIVDIGNPDNQLRQGGWNGHLLLATSVDERVHIADLALEQAKRPQKGIDLIPFHFCVTSEFLRDEIEVATYLNGSFLKYHSWPSEISFYTTADWSNDRKKQRSPIVGKIIRAIKNTEPNNRIPEVLERC